MRGGWKYIIIAVVLLGAAVAAFALRPPASQPAQYAGTEACAACHRQAFELWQSSHHRHAMEVAAPDSVLGDFNAARFDYFGTTSRFFTRDGSYFVETDNAKGELETFRVAYTFGWYPLQQYLIEFPDGRLQALSISWDSRPAAEGGQRWYHLYPNAAVTHEDALHWTGAFQNWNSRCASCHSTGLTKAYSQTENRYRTNWKELTVGCEACHGPGSRHLDWAGGRGSLPDKGLIGRVDAVWRPANGELPIPDHAGAVLSNQLQVCSGCHSRRTELQQPDPAAGFFDSYLLSPLLEGLYHPDGQILEEVYETGSFLQSRMHQKHVSCTNCHEPHGAQLRATGNALCLQCHEPAKFQDRSHFFHEPGSAGAQCVNCHMPQNTYMGVDARRDHSFRVPDPIASLQAGTPNACTQCHQDRDDKWAAAFITQRTGRDAPRYPHATLLARARRHDASVAPELLRYAGDAAHPPILRAIAMQESARFPSQQQVDVVAGALTDSDPLVRAGAAASLGFLEAGQRLAGLASLIEDPVKAVRMSAARQLIDIKVADAPAELQARLGRLFEEYRTALQFNADMPESMNDLGVFLSAQGDVDGAEQAFRQARQLSPRYLPAMLNLSDVYRTRQRDDAGEALLREALRAYPDSADVHYTLGLLLVRTQRTAASVSLFARARELAPGNAQYALVHAVSLAETGRRGDAIRELEAASRRFPGEPQILQALQGYRSTSR